MNIFDKIKEILNGPAAVTSAPLAVTPGKKSVDLILEFEGVDQPWARPPGASGITIGYGFDLGYCSASEFVEGWSRHLSLVALNRLKEAIGKKGSSAQSIEVKYRGMAPVTKVQAREVFDRCTLPKWTKQALATFPGITAFSPDQQGALLSIVFNRGTSLAGPRRREMANIRDIIQGSGTPGEKTPKIVTQILNMQRHWPSDDGSTGHPGLRRRRRAEAALFADG